MPEVARPISLRLAPRHIEALKARAHMVSGTLTGVARELILTGLAGGDNKALGSRPLVEMALERWQGGGHLDADRLGFVAARDHAAIVVGESSPSRRSNRACH
jgi:hypothetical protein